MAVEKAPVWTFPTNPKRLGRWYGKGPADRSPGFECHGSRPAFRGPRNMETDGIMRKEDGPIRHKENGAVRFRYPCRESNPAPSFRRLSKEIFKEPDGPARKGKGWPTGPDLIGSGLPPRSGFHGAREGVPAACPAGSRTRRRHKGENKDSTDGGLGASGKGKDLGAPVGPRGGSWGTVRRTGPGSGSSDHSSEPSVSAGAFASRRRDAISRAAPPPSTTTVASAISAMPAPVWARLLR